MIGGALVLYWLLTKNKQSPPKMPQPATQTPVKPLPNEQSTKPQTSTAPNAMGFLDL